MEVLDFQASAMETTWSPCLHNTAGVILLKWKFFCHLFAKNPQWSWIIFKKSDPDDLNSPCLSGLKLSVILCSSYGRCSLNSLCFHHHRAFAHATTPVESVFHLLPTCLTFYSTFKTHSKTPPFSVASLNILSTTDQIAPENLTTPLSWYWPFIMAVFCLHVFLLQQTVGSLCEATHVSLTLTLPLTSEYWHMDGSYILKGIQLSQYASKHFSMDYVELHIKVRMCVRMGVRKGDHMPCQSDGDSWNHLQPIFNYCLFLKEPGWLGCFLNREMCRQSHTHTHPPSQTETPLRARFGPYVMH